MMQIKFTYETKYGTFSDALNLPDDQTYSDEEITAMKEARRDNWINYIDTMPVEEIPPIDPTDPPVTE